MPTQPHTEQSPQSATESKERNDALNCNIKTELALRDLDGFLIAALCIIRMEDQYGDTSEENKKEALETLMEHAVVPCLTPTRAMRESGASPQGISMGSNETPLTRWLKQNSGRRTKP